MTALEEPVMVAGGEVETPLVIATSLLERVLEDASLHGQTLSEWFREAADRYLQDARARALLKRERDEAWRELMAGFAAENGPFTDEELAAAAADWPDDMVSKSSYPPAPMKPLSVLLDVTLAEDIERLASIANEPVAKWIARACKETADRLTAATDARAGGGQHSPWQG